MAQIKFISFFMTILILSADWAFADVRDLKMDPRGRGDGFDITSAEFEIRCYNDDGLESRRPYPPHPLDVKATQAEKKSKASWKRVDRAKQKRDTAFKAYEASFKEVFGPPKDNSITGAILLDILKDASEFMDKAYAEAERLLSSDSVTFEDFYNNPEKAIGDFFVEYGESLLEAAGPSLFESVLATDIMEDALKDALLEKIKSLRDEARNAYNTKKANYGPREKFWVSDPELKLAFDKADNAYNRQYKIAAKNARLAYAVQKKADNAPSDLPPCDSDELTTLLDEYFCSDDTPEFFTASERRKNPAIAKRFDAYIVRVCKAVSGSTGNGSTATPPRSTPPSNTVPRTTLPPSFPGDRGPTENKKGVKEHDR